MSDNPEFKKLEAVKDLIFGSEIDSFKKHFTELEAKINDLNSKLDEIKKSLASDLSQSNTDLVKKIASTDNRLEKLSATKQDTNKLGQLISKLGQKLMEESK